MGLKIIFLGTPGFAVPSLKAIVKAGYNVVAVVTSADKPAGRGYQLQMSPVKQEALELGLPVLQPINLKAPEFISELQSYQAELQVVIAFRMLPELVWNMPALGTFNLHGSYLPSYRGAAPINRAIMNGETSTGLTTFFLKHEIDTGNILLREKVLIHDSDNAGTLHDKMMEKGAELVIKSLAIIEKGTYELIPQEIGDFPHAPKIFSEDCFLNPEYPAVKIHNHIRGLSPYPAAFTFFREKKLKVFASEITDIKSSEIGTIEVFERESMLMHCNDYCLRLTDVQIEGKKRMPAKDFIAGLQPIR